nr:hypothetical protein [Microbacterium barkeri]
MEFLDTFWATMWGALAGAVVGAFASWLFSLNLQHREQERSDSRERVLSDAQHKRDLDLAVAEVVRLLGAFNGAADSYSFAALGRNPSVVAAPPHAARGELLSAVRVAQMTATPEENPPLEATYALLTSRDERTDQQRSLDIQHAADVLSHWRRGVRATGEAATLIRHRPPVGKPEAE